MDQADRDQRHARATELAPALADQGVVGVATSFVDNAGISRVKTMPVAKLPELAAWGAGFSTAFDYFRADDWVAAPSSGAGPVGDQRMLRPPLPHPTSPSLGAPRDRLPSRGSWRSPLRRRGRSG